MIVSVSKSAIFAKCSSHDESFKFNYPFSILFSSDGVQHSNLKSVERLLSV